MYWLEMELYVHFSFFILGFCLVWILQVLCSQSLCEFIHVPVLLCLENTVWSYLSPLVVLKFSPFFHVDTRVLWEGFDKGISFRAECSKVSHSLHIVQLWTSVLSTIYCKRNFFDEGWELLFSLGIGICH